MISNFDTDNYVELDRDTKEPLKDADGNLIQAYDKIILFYVAAFFMPIVITNLTVAVMSDTYNRVMATVNLTCGKDKNNLILNYENFAFWMRFPKWCCECF